MNAFSLSLGAAAMLGTLAGCHDEPAPQVPQPLPPPTMTAPPPPPPAETAAVPPPPAPVAQPCDSAMQLALQTALKGREKAELGVGMKPESTGFTCMSVPEGGSATVPVMLQPGRCYSFLGGSFPNVTELDLLLKPNFGNPPPPLLAMFANAPMAQDSDTGPAAAIGKGRDCFKNPFPIPGMALIEVKARTGAGPIAVQIYSK